jgi:hypothetical protein
LTPFWPARFSGWRNLPLPSSARTEARFPMNLDLIERAHARYWRDRDGACTDAPLSGGEVVERKGVTYVVLANGNGPLAIYRETPTGKLKELKWDGEIFARIARRAGHRM